MTLIDTFTKLGDGFRKVNSVEDKLSFDDMIAILNPNPNLYGGSKDFSGDWGYIIGSDKDHPGDGWYKDGLVNGYQVVSLTGYKWHGLYRYYSVNPGEKYTYSAWIKHSVEGSQGIFVPDDSSDGINFSLPTEWKRIHFTFTVASGITKIDPRFGALKDNGTLSIYGIKLEKGSIVTPMENWGGNS